MRVVLDGLGIKGTWKDSLLTITDEKFKTSSKIISDLETSGIDFYNTPKGVAIDTNEHSSPVCRLSTSRFRQQFQKHKANRKGPKYLW